MNVVERYGKVVHLIFKSSGSVTGQEGVIAKIPEGYRPSSTICTIGAGILNSVYYALPYKINTNGDINQNFTYGTLSDFLIDVTYLIDS